MTDPEFTAWRTSSYSGSNGGECVEVASADKAIGVRDSKQRRTGHIVVPGTAWRHFAERLRNARA